MKKYKNISGKSGVMFYAAGEDFIEVKFRGKSAVYIYNYSLNGERHIENMKILAVKGKGLGGYISKHPDVRNNYLKR